MRLKDDRIICPHCCQHIRIDQINQHIMDIFCANPDKCSNCSGTTHHFQKIDYNDLVNESCHKNIGKHKLQLLKMVRAASDALINSITNAISPDKDLDTNLADETDNNDCTVLSENNDECPQSTFVGDKSLKSNISNAFFSDTIHEINEIGCKCDEKYLVSEDTLKNVSVQVKKSLKKFEIKVLPNIHNKALTCRMCNKSVLGSYIERRKHIFEDHLKEIKFDLDGKGKIKKSDVLFTGFKIINNCFPNEIVFTDFQCLYCGKFFGSSYGMTYHVGSVHQNSVSINCPFDDCNYKSGNEYTILKHVSKHLPEYPNGISMKALALYVTNKQYSKMKEKIKIGKRITKELMKYCFPFNIHCYEHFEKNFSKIVGEFKRSYLDEKNLDETVHENDESQLLMSDGNLTFENSSMAYDIGTSEVIPVGKNDNLDGNFGTRKSDDEVHIKEEVITSSEEYDFDKEPKICKFLDEKHYYTGENIHNNSYRNNKRKFEFEDNPSITTDTFSPTPVNYPLLSSYKNNYYRRHHSNENIHIKRSPDNDYKRSKRDGF
uniref:C2H2-type domain-containing protein n=1 Tax=Strongyloides venezuelensis TaxID=75913 RepID=A0A0K0EUR0_STRVS